MQAEGTKAGEIFTNHLGLLYIARAYTFYLEALT